MPLSPSIRIYSVPDAASVSSDGRFFTLATSDGGVEIRRIQETGGFTSIPAWFVPFAEAVGGFRLGVNDRLESIPWDERKRVLESVREMTVAEPMIEWARSLMLQQDP